MAKVLLLILALVFQDKKEPPKPVPKVLVCAPPAVAAGRTTKIVVRGMNLDTATDVKVEGAAEVKVKSKTKVALPNNADPEALGNSQVELEVKVAADATTLSVVVTTPVDTAPPHALLVVPADRLVAEKEPNGGFAQAQPLEAGNVLQGAVGTAKDVDVFSVTGRKGETWTFEVSASRLGSPLDAILTLYDPSGHAVASRDDTETRDALLRITLPADGAYCLSLIDAHDQGGPTHVYHLTARRE